jgi:hypothetical protein
MAARAFPDDGELDPEQRPFVAPGPWPHLASAQNEVLAARHVAVVGSKSISLIENAEMKRRWIGAGRGSFALEARSYSERCADAAVAHFWSCIAEEIRNSGAPMSLAAALGRIVRNNRSAEALAWLSGGSDPLAFMLRALTDEAVPFLTSLRFTPSGLEKRAAWERTWDLQRLEDAGKLNGAAIPVPPKYDANDYSGPSFWRLRGKLDVPKERFISYPGAERDDDKSPLIGWAGWDHLQRAQALAALYEARKTEEGWPRERLVPLLAGILELVPWLKQWHNDPNPEFGDARLGDYFEGYVTLEASALGATLDELRAWRPAPAKARPGRKPTTKKAKETA